MRKIFGIFAFLCVFISCLGLLGLSCFVVNKRKKEIGIRKVHGASEVNIVVLLSREYMKSIILANIIA
jgi:putative ABC transport system permease protein